MIPYARENATHDRFVNRDESFLEVPVQTPDSGPGALAVFLILAAVIVVAVFG